MNEGLLDAITATRRLVAEFESIETGLYAIALDEALRSAAPGSSGEMPVRALAAEIGAATRRSDRTVERRLSEAFDLTTRFPATNTAFSEGRIDRAHVAAIVDTGTRIEDDEARAAYEQMAVAVGERESVARLRDIARRLAEKVLPRPLAERHRDAARRGVWVADLDDGMAELRALLPAALAHGIVDRLTRIGIALRHAPAVGGGTVGDESLPSGDAEATSDASADDRTMDQLRADLLSDVLLTGAPSLDDEAGGLASIRAEVLVTVPALTLAGRPDVDGSTLAPATLDGMTPIDPATARRLAGAASGWDRALTHPITGAVLAVDRYRPSAELRRYLRATDQRCRFLGCRRPARRCDLDHLDEASQGGVTAEHNLTSECERHHVVRHAAGWKVRKLPGGTIEWTSPTGRVYCDHPPGVVFSPIPSAPVDDLAGVPF